MKDSRDWLTRTVDRLYGWRFAIILPIHAALIVAANQAAFWLRFDGVIPAVQRPYNTTLLPLLLVVRLGLFIPLRLHQGIWRYASIWDLRNIVIGVTLSSVLFWAIVHGALGITAYPRSVFIIDALLLACLMGGVRLARRLHAASSGRDGTRSVLIYGAGDAGEMIVRDMRTKRNHEYQPIGFVDDDPAKVGLRIHGVPVLGTRDDLARIMVKTRPDEVLVAIPRANPAVLRDVVRTLEPFNVPIKTLPNLHEILNGHVEVQQIRNLSVQDLLSRGAVGLDIAPVRAFLKGRRVMVTGAGGSIGTELCRQIARFDVASLVLFDRSENGLFHALNDLHDRGRADHAHVVVGDITDRERVEQVLGEHSPDIIFHAAAHKHVPMMEGNACEAVKNNVTGTRIMAESAERFGVDRFILISTDKAVNPTSVMGATKRVAELMLLSQSAGSGSSFMTVRFGNVLGSAGSVVPRFLDQIKAGGPVTVTHPDIRRYFMLIPEAVQLVLHAAAHGESGRLYVLEMGEEVRLVDMARHLIRLAGFVPETEVPIVFVGLRPGEKLYEEVVGPDETTEPSGVAHVMHVRSVGLPDAQLLASERTLLEEAANRNDSLNALEYLGRIVPAFKAARLEAMAASRLPTPTETLAPETSKPVLAPHAAAGFEYRCPECGAADVHRSHARSHLEEWWKSLSDKRPYRCHGCGWRGWLAPMEPSGVRRVPVVEPPVPDFEALDESVGAGPAQNRTASSPRNLTTP